MKKIIKRTGNSACIILDREDLKIYELEIGDIVQLHIKKEIDKNEPTN